VPFGELDALERALDERTAAVLLEPVQGEGGIIPAPPGYLAGVRAACEGCGALLILDEIQTGLGRTGRWWASEHDGVVPDIMTTAKSLGGSLVPISATIFTEELREFLIPNPFIHLSTFGGSDLACAVALEVIAVIEETGLVEHAAAMGERLLNGLHALARSHPEMIAEVRGRGLMAGIQYREDSLGPRMSYQLARHGVLAIYSGNEPSVMRLMPALVIEEAEVDYLLAALERAIADLLSGAGTDQPVPARPRRRPARAAGGAH
jgi:putrescine aminotransferase